jgi:hypothetical protein
MKQSQESIQKSIMALRALIDSSPDQIVCRIAYAVETALRWATINTHEWPRPEQDVLEKADILRCEIRAGGKS